MKRYAVLFAVCACFLATTASASTVKVGLAAYNNTLIKADIDNDGTPGGATSPKEYKSGLLALTVLEDNDDVFHNATVLTGTKKIAAFCIDLRENVGSDYVDIELELAPETLSGTNYWEVMGVKRADAIKRLWHNNFDNTWNPTSKESTAFQIAVHEILHEGDGYSFAGDGTYIASWDVDGLGNYAVTNDPLGAVAMAQSWLDALNENDEKADLRALSAPHDGIEGTVTAGYQDLIYEASGGGEQFGVPEPVTLVNLLGLATIGLAGGYYRRRSKA